MKYAIGIDAGITSVGHAVMLLNQNDEPYKIYEMGSRIFDAAEHPKTGQSLAEPRREKRGLRRTVRRHQHRNQRIRYMLIQNNVISEEELEILFSHKLSDIYALRVEALDRKVTNEEFARILIHLSQRRGFKSNRKNDSKGKEAGQLLSAVKNNESLMAEKGYRTVGEMFFKDEAYQESKRNKGGTYIGTVSRGMVEEEIHKIFEAQRKYGNKFATKETEQQYCDIVLKQRPFNLGPGKMPNGEDSPYGGNMIEKMIGQCTFFSEEKRAVKATYSFQLFTLWQRINNIRIDNIESVRGLTDEERQKVFNLCHTKKSPNYSDIRKTLELKDIERFVGLRYNDDEFSNIEAKEKFEFLKAYQKIKTALNKYEKNYITQLSQDELDVIGTILTIQKTDDDITRELKANGIREEIIPYLLDVDSFSGCGHISVKVCKMIIPGLEKGLSYDVACKEAGINFKGHDGEQKGEFLNFKNPLLEDINNPVVKRCISQTIKVVNAIIREMGNNPTYINIELARELAKTKTERDKIKVENDKGQTRNQQIIDELRDNFKILSPSGLDIVKLKLYHEQNEICPYSQKPIVYERIFENGYTEVDHIKPFSISFDDSYNNKVLVLTAENRQKSNQLPMQYLSGTRRDDFVVWVNNQHFKPAKKRNLLKEKFTDEDEKQKERHLNDTKYLSRVMYNLFNDCLKFEDFSSDRKKHVRSVNGAATAYIRKRWGIKKIREDGDLHHAVDAVVIACTTEKMIQKISKYSKWKETKYSDNEELPMVVDENGEVIDTFPFPYFGFRKELDARTQNNPVPALQQANLPTYTDDEILQTKPCFVSRMPKRKVKGAAHADTVRSGKYPGQIVSKVDLCKLKLKNGEIVSGNGKYFASESDRLLYNAIYERLEMFGGDGEKAFKDCKFYKPKSNGEQGPLVKKVKIIEDATLTVPVRKNNGMFTGVAANGDMARIDIFKVEGDGFYFVPIYVSDTLKKELPNKACVANKKYDEWKEMKDEDFIFSLYPNDLVKVTAKKLFGMTVTQKDSTLQDKIFTNEQLLYYIGADISASTIKVITNDNSYVTRIGIKTLVNLEKYTVDVLGNYSKVKKEKRETFDLKKGK